ANPGGVYKSADGGVSWTQMNVGLGDGSGKTQSARRVQALAIDTRQPAVVYAGTQGAGVWKSVNGGGTWAQMLPDPGGDVGKPGGFKSDCLLQPEILALVVDVTQPTETLYAGATGNVGNSGCGPTPSQGGHRGMGAGFFRFANGDWDRRMNGDFEVLLPTTLSTNVWTIAMKGPTIYVGTDIGVLRSKAGSGSWALIPQAPNASGFISLPVRALGTDPNPAIDSVLYAGTSGRGVFKRVPPNNAPSVGPQPWTEANTGLTALRALT